MKNNIKKFVLFVFVLILFLSPHQVNNPNTVQVNAIESVPIETMKNILKTFVFKLLSATNQVVFQNTMPTKFSDAKSAVFTTGDINFSNPLKGNVEDIQLNFEVKCAQYSPNMDVSIFVVKKLSNLFDTCTLRMYKEGSSTPVMTGNLAYNSLKILNIKSNTQLGKYFIIITEQDTSTWNFGVKIYDNYQGGGPVKPEPYFTDPKTSVNLSGITAESYIIKTTSYTQDIKNNYYLIPSQNHHGNTSSITEFSFEQLENQRIDTELNNYVLNYSNLNIGDKLVISDTVLDSKYREIENVTSLFFSGLNNTEVVELRFYGDLTQVYSKDTKVKLKAEVTKIDTKDGTILESLSVIDSMILYLDGEKAPCIDEFIIR